MHAAFWAGLAPFATVLSAAASACALAVGAVSLWLIARQTAEAARIAQQTTAFDAHKEYLRFCIEHPDLSSSYMMLRSIDRPDFSGILGAGTIDTERALWFLSYVLFAMEQLATSWCRAGRIDPAWESTIVDQLGYHAALLIEVWPEWKHHYGSELHRLVELATTKDDPLSMALAKPARVAVHD